MITIKGRDFLECDIIDSSNGYKLKKLYYLVTIHVAIKRAHRRVQTAAVRTPVSVSELEHLHVILNRFIHTTVNFSR